MALAMAGLAAAFPSSVLRDGMPELLSTEFNPSTPAILSILPTPPPPRLPNTPCRAPVPSRLPA